METKIIKKKTERIRFELNRMQDGKEFLLVNAPIIVYAIFVTGCRNGIGAIVNIDCGTGATTMAVPVMKK